MTDQRTTYTIEETLRCMAIEWTINDNDNLTIIFITHLYQHRDIETNSTGWVPFLYSLLVSVQVQDTRHTILYNHVRQKSDVRKVCKIVHPRKDRTGIRE